MTRLSRPTEIVALALVNDVQQSKDYSLQDGDVVKLAGVFSGG